MLGPRTPIRLDPGQPPLLLVVVDTEEEFDWAAGFHRSKTTVRNIARLPAVQAVFDGFGVRPTYVVDYPVAAQEESAAVLREFAAGGRAVVGTHLHPWVNPPHEEVTTAANSYPGNLPRALERAKLAELTEAIEGAFGERPRVYRAGRYGLGPNSASILEELGYEVDLSVRPRIDFAGDGGPDFRAFGPEPFWFGNGLLEVPGTADYVGWLRGFGGAVGALAVGPLPGLLWRLRAWARLKLTPEGMELDELKVLTRSLLRRGQRVFVFDFHSPSAEPGHTPYVRTEADLQAFLELCRRYCDFFLNEVGGAATTPLELKARLA